MKRQSFIQLCVLCVLVISAVTEDSATINTSTNPIYVPLYHQSNDRGEKVTILTFYIEQEAEQAQDFLEVNFEIKTKDSHSLKKAIDDAGAILQKVKNTALNVCQNYGGADCEDRLDIGNHQIVAEYQRVRKQQQFKSYVVTHEVVLTVKEAQSVGDMLDKLASLGIYKINSFEWKPFEEVNVEEIAINNGIAQGKDLCEKINRKIGQILAIEEVYSADDGGDEGGEEEQQEEEEQGESPSILKFQVECVGRTEEEEQAEQAQGNVKEPEEVPEPEPEPEVIPEEVAPKKDKKKKKKKQE